MLETPNLSSKLLPQPKPIAKEKSKPKALGAGKKTKEWDEERKQLKEEFEKLGITSCEIKLEGCWKNKALGFAHLDKRRNLTLQDLPQVVLACNVCHDEIELLNTIRMRKVLEKIIRERKV